jgi:hypothetical protein
MAKGEVWVCDDDTHSAYYNGVEKVVIVTPQGRTYEIEIKPRKILIREREAGIKVEI